VVSAVCAGGPIAAEIAEGHAGDAFVILGISSDKDVKSGAGCHESKVLADAIERQIGK
jgi:hypothetical protein